MTYPQIWLYISVKNNTSGIAKQLQKSACVQPVINMKIS